MEKGLFKGGSSVLFIGIESYTWSYQQFLDCANFAKQHGYTGIALKVADGGNVWYGGYAGIDQRIQWLESVLPVIPYTYCYSAYVPTETAILAELLKRYGGAIADLEVEFNGNVAAAQAFNAAMLPVPGVLYITTWADPVQQNWTGVVNALAPCSNGWIPQEYDTFLESTANSQYPSGLVIYPALDLTQEMGPNDPVQIAKDSVARGDSAIFTWEYIPATQNPTLAQAVNAAFYVEENDPVTQQKILDLENAYNKVVAEKNTLVGQQQVTQKKLTDLETAYNKVVAEKNTLVNEVNQKQSVLSATVKADLNTLSQTITKIKQDAGF